MNKVLALVAAVVIIGGGVVLLGHYSAKAPGTADTQPQATSSPSQSQGQAQGQTNTPTPNPTQPQPERVSVVGYWECLPKKGSGPHTMECAFGIAIDQSDGHLAINTALMSTYPVDFPTGTKVRVSGVIHPAEPNTSYDIDGVIWATTIEKL